jgi:hypothetical protein
MSKSNGGFPPIKYCPEKDNNKNIPSNNLNSRQRLFSSSINKNINIRQILKESLQKPVIDINSTKEDLDIIDRI